MDAKRERYTPNDVGPSPLEWAAPRLSEVSTLITNGFVGTATPFYTDNSGVPYLYGTNVRANKIEDNGIRYVTREFHENQSKTALKVGDLLTVQSGHIGETAVVTEQFEGANCHALIVTRLKQNKAYPEFLSYYVNSVIGRARMKGLEVGSTILHINTKDLKKFRVLLPSLPEQKKIAQILSTWDKAITTTEQLLANSQQQKKALMQQLLTGKKRLLDNNGVRFGGEWKKSTLSSFGKSIRGVSYKPENISEKESKDTIRLLRSTNIQNGNLNDKDLVILPKELVKPNQTLEKGDLAICMANGSKALVGKSAPFEGSDITYTVGAFCAIFRPLSENNAKFVKFLFESSQYQSQLLMILAGSSINNLKGSDIESIKIFTPICLEEQQKIATVLSTADQEISALQQKLDALKQEKKALMQQLLTGKRRVVIE